MNPLQPASMFFSQGNPGVFSDVEMLQTDAMRFFAILCLCLMAIFALVKALPMGPPPDQPAIAGPADLKAEADALQKQIAELKEKLAQTQTRVQEATEASDRASTQAAKAEKAEQEAFARVVKTRQELEKVSQSLSETRSKIEIREVNLEKIVKDIDDKQRIRAELKAEIEEETKNLAEIRATLNQTKEKLAQGSQQNQRLKDKQPAAAPQPEKKKRGFSLRFDSDAALETMITRKQVRFFAIAGMKAWQLELSGGYPVYVPSSLPKEIYEMEALTVPNAYTSGFHRQVAAFGRHKMTWGVTLPVETTSSINQIIRGRSGGDLVIMANGAVRLNE